MGPGASCFQAFTSSSIYEPFDTYEKVSNTIGTVTPVTFVLPFNTVASSGTLQVLQGSATTSNTPTNPNAAVPVTSNIATGKSFTYNAPGFSVSVITLVAH
ncbi:hypothetical protein H0H87_002383 [Tephrocybe sp. NHM501043]|nr:hypothetical protein H0H87_002383 [Tephrocybe sp. NHM501043]